MMKEFNEEEIVKLHECLKALNIPDKLPSETNYYVDIFNLILDKLNMNDRLTILLFISYETIFRLISERELVEERREEVVV